VYTQTNELEVSHKFHDITAIILPHAQTDHMVLKS